ncbi:hypothetical protein LV89_02016 [Arcicella aurantiaca]|uniref:Uncharacterized protein n=1 Tax=Arcicella aurantiaca TaxID=591202 RepID=A0A316EB76_9BACT|nr:hypothetical protein [Arcicella aurantiaca]PWK27201.1 hypothetical protein LV89_02016 [Arcicella aurantiaca]
MLLQAIFDTQKYIIDELTEEQKETSIKRLKYEFIEVIGDAIIKNNKLDFERENQFDEFSPPYNQPILFKGSYYVFNHNDMQEILDKIEQIRVDPWNNDLFNPLINMLIG